MNIFHPPDNLVDQELDVVIGELLGLDDVVEVCPHEVGHHVHIRELIQRALGGEAVQQPNYLEWGHELLITSESETTSDKCHIIKY